MNYSSILYAIAYIWRAKKVWRRPKQAKTMIYDRSGSEVFLEYIDQKDVSILEIRGESINVYALLKCAFSLKLSLGVYAAEYASFVKPSVIITFIDNDTRFWELKSKYPKAITIFVQNGWRGDPRSILGCPGITRSSVTYQVDYMLTFGIAIGERYHEYIKGKVVPIGSIKNNLCLTQNTTNPRSVVFISQFRPSPEKSGQAHFVRVGNRAVTWDDFYLAESTVLQFLAHYCEQNQFIFQICGCISDPSGQEYEFFRGLIGDKKWQFLPRDGPYGSYESVDGAGIVVGIGSTLLYESLARGKKTGIFSIRGTIIGDSSRNFGWPEEFADNGPFWTNHADESEFRRILGYLSSVSDADWENTRKEYVSNLMEYDPGNTRFVSLLQKLEVQLNSRYVSHIQK